MVHHNAVMIFERAVSTLTANDRGGTTIPSPHLYPHQWSWDSAFIAIGLAHVDPQRAWQELRSLFGAQWADGRVPHIVFNPAVPADAYFPGAAFWQPMPPSGPPAGVVTTGLVQPPVHAIAAAHIVGRTAETHQMKHIHWLYPRLRAWHDYLFDRRRLDNGLVATLHPWESGLDNSPAWDAALAAVPTEVAGLAGIAALRRDVRAGNVDQRPTNADYARYLHIAQAYRAGGYADDDLTATPFCVADPLTNAVLAWAEQELATLATMVGEPPDEHRRRAAELEQAIHDHLYVPDLGCYAALDARSGRHAPARTVGGLVPLVLDAMPPEVRAAVLVTATGPAFKLGDPDVWGVPSYDLTAADVDRRRYWRGPSWINTTWLVWAGLRRAGGTTGDQLATELAADMITMVERQGFREYFDPLTGAGLGARDFSWSAALALDVLAAARRSAQSLP